MLISQVAVTGSRTMFHVAVLLYWSTIIGDWFQGCAGNDLLGNATTEMITSTVYTNWKTVTTEHLFASSPSDGANDEITFTRRSSSAAPTDDARTDSPNLQVDTSAVWHLSSIYATSSSKKTITPLPTYADRETGNNTATTFTTATKRAVTVSTAQMTRFSGSSTDVISLTQPTAATVTPATSPSSRRSFEPSIYASTTTTTEQLSTYADVDATTDWPPEVMMTTNAAGETGSWLSLSVAWIAGAIAAGVVVLIVIIITIIIIICRRFKSSRSSTNFNTVRYNRNKDIIVDMQSVRGKRSKEAASLDMDGVCITYTRSQPPSSANITDNVFIGAFPHNDRWMAADNDPIVNDLFEKDSETDSMYEQATSTFCARNASYRGHAPVTADHRRDAAS